MAHLQAGKKIEMQNKIELITTWFKVSRLKVNGAKRNYVYFIKKTPAQLRSL